MRKGVLVIVLLAVVAMLAYVGYHSDDKRRAGTSGEVFSNDSALDRAKSETSRSSSGAVQAESAAQPQGSETIVYPAAGSHASSAGTDGTAPLVTQSQQAAPATAPGGDTISPNPPNGMAFAGTGRYQVYRQGNITWRLDTETGRSCILFATDEEWKKPRVYKAGCGRS
ncbi:hypothetical protein [Edaphobacter aggregans]|uniref:hypothetical protein n=1 Tax=Edaphobacter aggregans TaxID=570835 RepID=UPI00054D14DF|nr:hypothetical protein [Edaphobacter aggregans]